MNLNWLRQLLPRSFKQQLKSMLGMPSARIHADWTILKDIPLLEESNIVLDIGARNGWFSQCWQDLDHYAIIHQFEPEPIAAGQLKIVADKSDKLIFNAIGLGDKAENLPFHYLTESKVSSSFLRPDEKVWEELQFNQGEVEVSSLPVIRLDDYCQEESITSIRLMKIDVQGFELKVLEGSLKVLENTDYVLIESAIKPLYHEAASFTQVHEFMIKAGFHLQNMRAWHRGNKVLMETDMLFRHDRLAGSIDNSIERIYTTI